MTVAVDALGGDDAPGAVVAGALQAIASSDVAVLLVGPSVVLTEALASSGLTLPHPSLRLLDATESVAMDESPLVALRRKPRASVKLAAEAVARGDAQALFSAGHTGATLLAARAAFGLLAGAERPALAVTLPTITGRAVLLDAGASVDCRADHLVQFARMGAAYARVVLTLASPRVGLLSIGEEAGKGNELIREAHAALAALSMSFIGNLEARDLFSGRAEVIVCDGFTGNIALKVSESLIEAVDHLLREALGDGPSAQALSGMRQRLDYAEYGGAPLLGVGAPTVVAHGRSSPKAIARGIAMAAALSRERVVERLGEALEA